MRGPKESASVPGFVPTRARQRTLPLGARGPAADDVPPVGGLPHSSSEQNITSTWRSETDALKVQADPSAALAGTYTGDMVLTVTVN